MSSPVLLITGAANGIGHATALLAAQRGAQVFAVDQDERGLDDLVAKIERSGGTADSRTADVSSPTDVEKYVQGAIETYGAIDAFFNNAGRVGLLSPITDYPVDVFDEVVATNLRGVFLGLQHVLRHMHARRHGSVVNTASVAGLVGHVDHGAYVASKHAVVGLTKVAGAESAPYGVRVNAICPGPVRTAMIESIERMKSPEDSARERDRLLANIPAHRYGTVEEIAEAALHLLIGPSDYLNGSTITVDGGFTAIR